MAEEREEGGTRMREGRVRNGRGRRVPADLFKQMCPLLGCFHGNGLHSTLEEQQWIVVSVCHCV